MSVQFGKWNFDGKPVDAGYFERVKSVVSPFGVDGSAIYDEGSIKIWCGHFHITKESLREAQPHTLDDGTILTWDGRLDNRKQLIHQLNDSVTHNSTDVEFVAAAYEQWGADSLAKLIGDWTLSIWNPGKRTLVLAKDAIGIRPLFYSFGKNEVTWSSVLDPLALFPERSLSLNEEYIAGWLSLYPAAHLTPYRGIYAVPPASFVSVRDGRVKVQVYWDFDPSKRIRYRSDNDYEEHFRNVFAESVRRRLRSDRPVLAELSGGLDSSSIVCMADNVMARDFVGTPQLETVSLYNDSEPHWNERPYFTLVEKKRGQTGYHIDMSSSMKQSLQPDSDGATFSIHPGCGSHTTDTKKLFKAYVNSRGFRVVLSGTGGDEVLGGVPTPTPELADLLARANFAALGRQLVAWALTKRQPVYLLLVDALKVFLPVASFRVPDYQRPAPWINPAFVNRNRTALRAYEERVRLFGPLPSFQENVSVLDVLRRQLVFESGTPGTLYEKRYPYLDRDLLEFLYAIPREQFLRPGQRRSLVRRAMAGIVPDEILNRKRKAFVSRSPIEAISGEWAGLFEMTQNLVSGSLGIVDPPKFREALQKTRNGEEVPILQVLRTLAVEFWLQQLRRSRLSAAVPAICGSTAKIGQRPESAALTAARGQQ